MLLKGKHSGRIYDVRVKNIPWAQRDLDFFEECRLECNQLETPATLKLSKENT